MRNEKDFKVKVYTLADKNGEIFYVGITAKSIEERLRNHIAESKMNKQHNARCKKIIELDSDVVATIVHIETVKADKPAWAIQVAKKVENKWIQKYFDLGYDLCNHVNTKKVVVDTDHIGKTVHANHSIY